MRRKTRTFGPEELAAPAGVRVFDGLAVRERSSLTGGGVTAVVADHAQTPAATVASHLAANRNRIAAQRSALVVQGGAMRGVYSMGALAALAEHGLHDAFTNVYGSSAGAINAAYLLAGQAEEAVAVYVELLSNRRFLDMTRPGKVLDVDYLIDRVLKEQLPLDVAALKACPTALQTVLTSASSAKAVLVSSHESTFDMYEVFRATAAIPVLYNRQVRLGEASFIDGALAHPVPLQPALDDGASFVLAVLTRPRGHRDRPAPLLARTLVRRMARGQSPAVRARLGAGDEQFNEAMDYLEAGAAQHVRCVSVWPSEPKTLVARTTFDKARLTACAQMGRADMHAALAQPLT